MTSLSQVLQEVVGPAFEIGRELEGAGMSRVFLAREPALDRDVVVKVLPPDLLSTSSVQRFAREVQVTARLQHPHILPVITAGGNADLRYYVTPFIRGESLRARLAAREPLPLADALRIADQLLDAIAFAHARGVIHRDVKPGNILLSEGHAILADFGIAAVTEREHVAQHTDQFTGFTGSTLDSARVYVAPEHPRGEPRDLFAAGVVIHELTAGVAASPGISAQAIVTMLRARHPDAPARDLRKLAAILARAVAIDPAARYGSASELRAALAAMERPSRRPLLVGAGIGGLAATLALAAVALQAPPASLRLQSDTTPPTAIQAATPVSPPLPAPDTAPVGQPQSAHRVTESRGETATATAPAVTAPPRSTADSAAFMRQRGDFVAAMDLYQAATREHPDDSRAQLGYATLAGMINNPTETEASRVAAQRALEGTPALDAHGRALAEGFIALADRRFPEACAAFERARAERATFEAWYGVGECRLRDDAVVMDSTGKPYFRGGLATAFSAFASAIRVATPTAPTFAYRRLTQAVPQTSADVRVGRGADNRGYVGQWRVMGDTLGLLLSPTGVPRSVSPDAFVASGEAAKAGRAMLRPLLLSWVAQSPKEPGAHEALSVLLENTGVIAEEGDDRVSALTEIAKARKLETHPANALRQAASHARLLLRARQYTALASLADSLLAAHDPETAFEAEALIPIAMLAGRVERASSMIARISGTTNRQIRGADGRPVDLPGTVLRERADFTVRATLGVCDERVRSAPKRLVDLLDASFPQGVPRGVESNFLERTIVTALPCLGSSVVKTLKEPGRSLASTARAYDPNDSTIAAELAERDRTRPASLGGSESSVDGAIVEAMLKIAVKDSAAALKILTVALDRIPILNRGFFQSEFSIGGTVRAMALAAQIASDLGDRETAHRWASAVVVLWRNADPELQPQVTRLRAIARATSAGPSRE